MRLVAWNCCEKFPSNFEHLDAHGFDLAVVAECRPGVVSRTGISEAYVRPIPGSQKHLGVLARSPWSITQHEEVPVQPWLLPVRVAGPVSFTLLAFWAGDPQRFGSYTSQLRRVVSEVLPRITGSVVVAGDCNAPTASTARPHAANVAALAEYGLVSAYAATRDHDEAAEQPTYFHLKRRDRPFHIDHVFVPETWAASVSLAVGSYDDWVATGRSDHVPLTLDLV